MAVRPPYWLAIQLHQHHNYRSHEPVPHLSNTAANLPYDPSPFKSRTAVEVSHARNRPPRPLSRHAAQDSPTTMRTSDSLTRTAATRRALDHAKKRLTLTPVPAPLGVVRVLGVTAYRSHRDARERGRPAGRPLPRFPCVGALAEMNTTPAPLNVSVPSVAVTV